MIAPLEALALPDLALNGLENAASAARPEARQTHLATSLAQTQADGARSAMLPQVSFRGAFEADRQPVGAAAIDEAPFSWRIRLSFRPPQAQ